MKTAKQKAGVGLGNGSGCAEPARCVDKRHERIATAAYYKAESRGFSPGLELQDWLEAESEILGKDAD